MQRTRTDYPKRLLDAMVPFSADVEKTGVHRAPVATFAGNSTAAQAYKATCAEILGRM